MSKKKLENLTRGRDEDKNFNRGFTQINADKKELGEIDFHIRVYLRKSAAKFSLCIKLRKLATTLLSYEN